MGGCLGRIGSRKGNDIGNTGEDSSGHTGEGKRLKMVKIEAYHDGEFWCARGIGEDIFTQGETLDELIANIKESVTLHFDGIEP